MSDDIGCRELILNQLRNQPFARNQVRHGDVVNGYDTFRDGESDGRYTIDDNEGIANEGGFDGSGAAGNDGGAGVVEGGSGVEDETDGQVRRLIF